MPDNPIQLGLEQTHDESGNLIGRSYYGGTNFSMNQILQECQNIIENYPADSLESSRISKMIQTRDLSSFKTLYSKTVVSLKISASGLKYTLVPV